MEHTKKKRLRLPVLLFIILMSVTVVLCAAALGIWLYGKNAMTPTVQAPSLPPALPEPPAIEELPEETPEQPEEEAVPPEPELLDEHTIRYNGKAYRYNDQMCNLLLLGIDAEAKPAAPLPYGSDIQADVLVLAAMDLKNSRLTLISINRDTMCQIEILNEAGASLGYSHSQIALAYAYGDGLLESCRLTANAVSDLFYGLQLHGCGAFYMGGIADLNDALGGVTVNILDDFDFPSRGWAYQNMISGQEVTLTGQQAKAYIQFRNSTEDGNTLRMQRQKQYMLTAFSTALQSIKANPVEVFSIYDAVDDYILSDLNLSRMAYLASKAAFLEFDSDIRSLPGTAILSEENHIELTLDQTALYELMLDVFYEEVAE